MDIELVDFALASKRKPTLEPEPQEFFLCPVIHLWAEDEDEAHDKVIEAIYNTGVGEIPGWGEAPPTFEEKRLQQAAPRLLAACKILLEESFGEKSEGITFARAAIVAATGEKASAGEE